MEKFLQTEQKLTLIEILIGIIILDSRVAKRYDLLSESKIDDE